jgi:hypothetical protein
MTYLSCKLPAFVTVTLPVERSPGAIVEAERTADVGEVEMSTVPVVNELDPTDWLSVKIAPVAATARADTDSANTAPALKRRLRPWTERPLERRRTAYSFLPSTVKRSFTLLWQTLR